MLLKLIKYEWKAMMSSLAPVYVLTLVLTLINRFLINNSLLPENAKESLLSVPLFENIYMLMQVLLVFLYLAVLIAIVISTLIVTIQRFYKGLLKEEGYIMFMLPVKTWKLVFSKALVSSIVSVISVIVAILSIAFLGSGMDALKIFISIPGDIFNGLKAALQYDLGKTALISTYIAEVLIFMVITLISTFYEFYAAMALGQLSNKHKVAFSVLWYIVITTVLGIINQITLVSFIFSGFSSTSDPVIFLHIFFISLIVISSLLLAAFAFMTNYILDKKLNLE